MDAFLLSSLLVAVAEIGDKTQLLAICLAARFRRPAPLVAGMLVATILNHAAAGAAGSWVAALLGPTGLRWVVGLLFLGMAGWALIPDKLGDECEDVGRRGLGPFLATLVAFFLAEIGDKTQIATIGLAARFAQFYPVVLGTTLGMMLANIPVVVLGDRLAGRLPIRAIRIVAAAVFAVLGLLTIAGAGE